ncbi:MAG TPA: Arm DNA-binding domain-containing protein, partial [Rhizomicrobium sp.]|nr:Arm DNA-binding domain-containing protein [Rhizomicrobium sp.]
MATRLLDDKFLRNLKTKLAREDFFDTYCPGLVIRVTAPGRRAWNLVFTIPGTRNRARMTLGTYPATPLKEARDLAQEAKGKLERGKDPRKEEAADNKAMTVAELIEERMRLEVRDIIDPKSGVVRRVGLKSAKEIERRHNQNIVPVVGDVALRDFKITHLNKVIDPILERGHERSAGMAYSDLQTLFNFAVQRGELEYNPIAKARKRGSTGKERERALTLAEIKKVWTSLPHVMAQSHHVPQ